MLCWRDLWLGSSLGREELGGAAPRRLRHAAMRLLSLGPDLAGGQLGLAHHEVRAAARGLQGGDPG